MSRSDGLVGGEADGDRDDDTVFALDEAVGEIDSEVVTIVVGVAALIGPFVGVAILSAEAIAARDLIDAFLVVPRRALFKVIRYAGTT